jgi:H+/Cl- antiporter ClcA
VDSAIRLTRQRTETTRRVGAMGGLLTPGLSNGALFAITLGGAWNHWFPAVPLGSFAIVGAAAFLATSMRMPLKAIVLLLEFTRVNQAFLVPMLLAVAGSGGIAMLVEHFRTIPIHDAAPDVVAPLVYTGIATAPLPPTSAGSP